eukprot:COSAG01_NODE_5984_length_3919_cov_1.909686_5_plen_72_part_00
MGPLMQSGLHSNSTRANTVCVWAQNKSTARQQKQRLEQRQRELGARRRAEVRRYVCACARAYAYTSGELSM